jgi:hypothetical protein
MYSICGKTLAMVLAALWMMFTPSQPVPPTPTAGSPAPLHPLTSPAVLGTQSEEPISIALRVPAALVHAGLTEERSSATIDLRVPEALLAHLYGAGQVSGLEKSSTPWAEPF